MGEIPRIGRPSSGMEHLLKQTHGGAVSPSSFPKDKCLQIYIPLSGKTYFVPEGKAGLAPEPPFAMQIPLAYSEVTHPPDTIVIAIERHEQMQVVSAGAVVEQKSLPKWWEKRDQGSLI